MTETLDLEYLYMNRRRIDSEARLALEIAFGMLEGLGVAASHDKLSAIFKTELLTVGYT